MNGMCKKCGEFDIDDLHQCKLTFQREIDQSYPTIIDTDEGWFTDVLALELVGQRHGKRELVNLVRWIILDGGKACKRIVENRMKQKTSTEPAGQR